MTRLMGQEKQRISERIERLNAENTGTETARVLFLYTPADAGGFFEEQLAGRPGRPTDRRPTRCDAGMAGRSSVRRLFDIRFSQKLSGAATVCEG